jgi:hypothetical protein
MEPTASWVENDFESRPVEHLKDIIDSLLFSVFSCCRVNAENG